MQNGFEINLAGPVHDFVRLTNQLSGNEVEIQESVQDEGRKTVPRISRSKATGMITCIRISKSVIKQLVHKGEPYPVCPCKVYHTLLLRDIETPPSDSQIKGLYFETKCLGLSADGSATVDLARNKRTGARTAEHERIDQAIELFQKMKLDFGLIVDEGNTQVYHRRRWIDPLMTNDVKVYLDGTLDLISPITTPGYSFPAATIDLKLTRDRDVCEVFSNGLYHSTPWGNMETADFTEPMMYRLIFGRPFVYLVFDYRKDNAGYKDIPVITDIHDLEPMKAAKAQERLLDLQKSIRFVVDAILGWELIGWPMIPIGKICSTCPIMDCPKRNETIEV